MVRAPDVVMGAARGRARHLNGARPAQLWRTLRGVDGVHTQQPATGLMEGEPQSENGGLRWLRCCCLGFALHQ
jgi:hypothetical protein